MSKHNECVPTDNVAQIIALKDAEIARLRERIEKLEACVKAGDCLVGRDWPEYETRHRYEIARAVLGEVEREG